MSLPAFYLEAERWGEQPRLTGQEASHARVLRLKAGDKIALLDGLGKKAIARIDRVKRDVLDLSVLSEERSPLPSSRPVIAMALSKAVRRGFFMEKASELGAFEIWLWQAEFSQGKLSPQLAETCQRQLIAGMKQSGNPWLPQIRLLRDSAEVAARADSADCRILPWEELGAPPLLRPGQLGRPGLTVYAIGPEGGFSSGELETLKSGGFTPVSLGKRVLRCETAASLCLGLHWWASQLPDSQEKACLHG